MRTAVLRIQEGLGIGERKAMVVAAIALAIVVASVGLSTRLNLLVQVCGLLVGLIALLTSLRWPMLPLFVLAILIPIEEAVVLGGLGTLSRYAEMLFIVAYAVPRLGRLTIRAMPLGGWVYVAWAALSVGWAIDPTVTLEELPVLGLLFVTAVLIASAVAERPTIVRPVLWAYSLSAAVTAVIGILGYLHGSVGAADRVAALPGQDPAHYAALLLPALVFTIHELLAGRFVLLAGIVAMLCALGVIVSGTRGAWLSAAVVGLLYVLPRLSPMRRVAAITLVTAMIAVALQVPGVSALIADRADTAISSGGAGRTDIWSVGLLIYGSSPAVGVGLENFPTAYTPERIRESDVRILAPWRPPNRAAHNIIISTLGELGTVGLIFLAMFLAPLLLRRGWGPDAATVQAALASLVIMAVFLDLFNRKQVWLFLGIACGLAYLARRSGEAATASTRGRVAAQPPALGLGRTSDPRAAPGASRTT